jgi:Amt family ammonium transporter
MLAPVLANIPRMQLYPEQVSTDIFLEDVFYAMATVCLVFIVAAVGLIDAGLVRRKNVLDSWIQKLSAALVAGGAMAVIGYSIWIVQYYEAFGVPDPWQQAIKDWWIGGTNTGTFAQNLDPAVVPHADVLQVFLAFFVAYAMVGGALLHSAGLERVKALPMYIISAVAGGVVIPIVLYLTWGSTSPLTNAGVHDYIGVYSLYIVVGVWALIIAWRAGARLGAFTPDARTSGPLPHNLGTTAAGVGILLFAAPLAFLGCGYLIPGVGYFGISGTESGFGVALVNIFMAYVGGGLGGALISYRTRNPIMALLGVVAGYIGAGASMDIAKPWETLVIAFVAPFVVYAAYLALHRARIDDKKIVPLALGGGVYGALVAGVVGWGDKTGGYFGLEGEYALQNAEINLGWQAIGVLVTVAIAGVTGLLVIIGLEKTIGLRVSDQEEVDGLDNVYWQAPPPPYVETQLVHQRVPHEDVAEEVAPRPPRGERAR